MEYLKLIKEEVEKDAPTKDDIKRSIASFFKDNPKPSDKEVHYFAEKNGIDEHYFEEIIYELLGSFFAFGMSIEKGMTVEKANKEQLKMGIKVEMEHTNDPIIAEKIALDHLAEGKSSNFRYYDYLKEMEEKLESEN
jgi:hypothetical protein